LPCCRMASCEPSNMQPTQNSTRNWKAFRCLEPISEGTAFPEEIPWRCLLAQWRALPCLRDNRAGRHQSRHQSEKDKAHLSFSLGSSQGLPELAEWRHQLKDPPERLTQPLGLAGPWLGCFRGISMPSRLPTRPFPAPHLTILSLYLLLGPFPGTQKGGPGPLSSASDIPHGVRLIAELPSGVCCTALRAAVKHLQSHLE